MEEFNNMPQNQGSQQGDKKGLAIASMVLGIVSLVLFCIWYISVPCAILAIIFGALSTKSSGRGMAIAGLVLAIVAISLEIILLIIGASIMSSLFGGYNDFFSSFDY